MKQFWNGLPQLAKILIIVTIIITIWIIYRQIDKAIKRNKERKNPQETVKDADKDLKDEQTKGETLSNPESAYSASANAIEKLLDGCETAGSETAAIENVITVVKKPIDWFFLIKTFGVREISQCGSFGQLKDSYDLPALLKDQLDTSGVYSINIGGYKDSGFTLETINILRDYFKTINITI